MLDISLYAIIDDDLLFGHSLEFLAKEIQAGGASLIQYRAKNAPLRVMLENAKRLRQVLTIPFLINDRVDVALAVQADGVHLGQEDLPILEARKILGEKAIIGLTLKTQQHIIDAPHQALDYACCGAVFATQSKANIESALGLEGLKNHVSLWKSLSSKPLGAIAGINETNAKAVMATGVNGIAIISALSKSKDPKGATQKLKEALS